MVPSTIKIGIPTAPTQAPFDGDGIIKPEGPDGNDSNGGLEAGAWAGKSAFVLFYHEMLVFNMKFRSAASFELHLP